MPNFQRAILRAKVNLATAAHTTLDLFFPPTCAGCQRVGALICTRCAQAVATISQPICRRCGRIFVAADGLCSLCLADPTPRLQLIRAAALHIEPLDKLIHAFKYGNQPELARPLARYLCAAFAAPVWRPLAAHIDAVLPVPMFAERQRQRGYNQAELLAHWFCHSTGLRYQSEWLQRQRFERPQVGLNAKQRKANVDDAFVANPQVAGQRLLLIDDVYTTGSTLRACAAAALTAGATAIYGLALAIPTAKEQIPHEETAQPNSSDTGTVTGSS